MNGVNGVVERWTIEARHTEIAEDQVVLILTDHRYRFDTVASRVDHTLTFAQDGGEYLSEVLIVIHNQEALHGHGLTRDRTLTRVPPPSTMKPSPASLTTPLRTGTG